MLKPNEDIINYYYFSRVMSDKEIEEIKELSKTYPLIDGNVSGKVDKTYRVSDIKWIPPNDTTKDIYEKCKTLACCANERTWKFHVTNVKEHLQFTEYRSSKVADNGHYDWHMDFGKESSTRKVSMVILLSDPNDYEGGDLEFMIHRNIIKAPKEKGTAIFFPSYIMHRVTPVTSGTRNSLVTWYHGPPFV